MNTIEDLLHFIDFFDLDSTAQLEPEVQFTEELSPFSETFYLDDTPVPLDSQQRVQRSHRYRTREDPYRDEILLRTPPGLPQSSLTPLQHALIEALWGPQGFRRVF
ncbi:hypothetical protein CLIB1444_02S13740 [[Candida] jaroonii]|uniref:Uncharacterized protein n=1 Tax=[Candida] jaroonii TaxID=467808 RepID=A0ACA9Y405_9ASCO|nr:hypothetical protein CLIB1444_02S13740 [[Candida] jaroonii]